VSDIPIRRRRLSRFDAKSGLTINRLARRWASADQMPALEGKE